MFPCYTEQNTYTVTYVETNSSSSSSSSSSSHWCPNTVSVLECISRMNGSKFFSSPGRSLSPTPVCNGGNNGNGMVVADSGFGFVPLQLRVTEMNETSSGKLGFLQTLSLLNAGISMTILSNSHSSVPDQNYVLIPDHTCMLQIRTRFQDLWVLPPCSPFTPCSWSWPRIQIRYFWSQVTSP
jgi:hypothetical protein